MYKDFYFKAYIDKKKYPHAKIPKKAHETDAGFDVFTPQKVDIMPNGSALIDTGVVYEVPKGFCVMVVEKSGLAVNSDIHIGAKVIDADYRDTIKVHLINTGRFKRTLMEGNKIAQIMVLPVWIGEIEQVKKLKDLNHDVDRGIGGFGSTGS